MNNVVFVMVNSRLNKKDIRKPNEYIIDDLASDDEWIVEENEANPTFDSLDKDILAQIGEDANGVVAAPLDDLEIPPIANNNDHGGDGINEYKDSTEEYEPLIILTISCDSFIKCSNKPNRD
ncbi:hypothetical protein LR48_Vigan09g082900 [Vigna angularis]|uniref:Uncharacterized protein n=1 Tax=Phaseolus angularis TaxID=3914 RepID=A0A0L9VAS1_PHAAN|nr:hypothetical protein LR48_Vigan09g082900 [Vigna angularis]